MSRKTRRSAAAAPAVADDSDNTRSDRRGQNRKRGETGIDGAPVNRADHACAQPIRARALRRHSRDANVTSLAFGALVAWREQQACYFTLRCALQQHSRSRYFCFVDFLTGFPLNPLPRQARSSAAFYVSLSPSPALRAHAGAAGGIHPTVRLAAAWRVASSGSRFSA